ncbi:MAG: alpha/beta fold hydrolase [Streptosporangiaceae bacterium]
MDEPVVESVSMPGARLYCETRGSGPLLLFVVGGNGDSTIYQGVAADLAERFTVVTYDRRGFVRSPVDGPVDEGTRIATDTDDSLRLIEHHGGGPAHVFGSSSGAIVALDLVTRHPDAVRTVVLHEPPILALLPDPAKWAAFLDQVYEINRTDGLWPAMAHFGAGVGTDQAVGPPTAAELPSELTAMVERAQDNMAFWMEHELRQYPSYEPDLHALVAVADRIVLAGGRDSREHMPFRPNLVLGERLGRDVIEFPGGHSGYAEYPGEFAAQLGGLLTGDR